MLTRLSTLRLLTIFLICAAVAMWLATACTDDSGEVDPEVEERGMTAENLDEANEPSVVTPEVKKTKANDPAKVSPEEAEKDMTIESLNEVNQPSVVTPEVNEKEANDLSKVSPKDAEKDMTAENLDEANEPDTRSPVLPGIEANAPCDIDPEIEENGMRPHEIAEAVERARAIRHKHDDMFWRQPTVHGVGIGLIEDEDGEETGQIGFIIDVTEKINQNTLPPEDRIPDCLEGVPVEIRVVAKAELL